jgi:hypothetical protein
LLVVVVVAMKTAVVVVAPADTEQTRVYLAVKLLPNLRCLCF